MYYKDAAGDYIDIQVFLRYNSYESFANFFTDRGEYMVDNDKELNVAPDTSEEDEQLRKKREAEERVAKMFANAKTQSRRSKKKGSSMTYSDVPIASRSAVQNEKVKSEAEKLLDEIKQESDSISQEASTVTDTVDKQEKIKEAEERVAKMFANAKTQSNRAKKKGSSMTYSDVPIALRTAVHKETENAENEKLLSEIKQGSASVSSESTIVSDAVDKQEKLREAEEKVAKMFAESSTSGKMNLKSLCSLPPAETAEQQEKNKIAEDRLAEIFAAAEAQKNSSKKGSFGSVVTEIVILESISLFLFFITMNAESPSFLSLFAVLLPVIVGIGYRVVKQQIPLLEAISKCKLHIGATVFFFICIIFSV